jgi:protein-tyrosine-phosphatase
MIEYMNYDGALMIEYKHDPYTGNFALMEINGRYWGSLQLAISSGQNFPVVLAEMTLGEAVERRLEYQVERYCRHFSSDLSNAVRHVIGGRAKGGILRITAWSWLWSLRRVLLGRESWDLFTLSDPLPFLIDNYRSMSSAALKACEKVVEAARARLFNLPAVRRARRKKWLRLLGCDTKIVFVCFGNICRSPFAVELAKTRVNDDVKEMFLSAGTHPLKGRPSPGAAIRTAKSFGVDLKLHRSRTLEPKPDELYIVMDLANYRGLIKDYSIEPDRVIPLSFFDNSYRSVEIRDPFGESDAEFQHCYGDVARLIDELLRSLAEIKLQSKGVFTHL